MALKYPIPLSLKINGGLFILLGIAFAVEIAVRLTHGELVPRIGVLGIFVGVGLLRLSRFWRTCALVWLWLLVVVLPLATVIALALGYRIVSVAFGQTLEYPEFLWFLWAGGVLAMSLWQLCNLTRPHVRSLFEASPGRAFPVRLAIPAVVLVLVVLAYSDPSRPIRPRQPPALPRPALPALDVPEVGPTVRGNATVALRAALTAFGVPFDAEAIDRDCQLDAEGAATLDNLEAVARKYGLAAQQATLPVEHLCLPEAGTLPAILLVTQGSRRSFALLWRTEGDQVQVLDPQGQRRWVNADSAARSAFVYEHPVPAADLIAWIRSDGFRVPLMARLLQAGIVPVKAEELVQRALAEPGWRGMAALDAALRAKKTRADDLMAILKAALACSDSEECLAKVLPTEVWHVRPAPADENGVKQITLRGALLVTLGGRQ